MTDVLDYAWFVVVPQMIDGLMIGTAVVLVAAGLTLIFGLLRVINVAHGELYMLGAYFGFVTVAWTGSFLLALLLAPLAVGVVGLFIERFTIRPLDRRRDRAILTILVTFGLSLVLRDVAQFTWGVETHRVDAPVGGAAQFAGVFYSNYRLVVLGAAGAVILALWWVIQRTTLGAILRATAHDPHMIAALGVPARAVIAGTVFVSCALAAFAGVLLSPIYAVFPHMGHDFILIAFAVVIVGGLGSLAGAVVAGLGLAQLQSLGSLVMAPVWAETMVFVAMIAVLIVRPNGLFGRLGS